MLSSRPSSHCLAAAVGYQKNPVQLKNGDFFLVIMGDIFCILASTVCFLGHEQCMLGSLLCAPYSFKSII